MSFATPLYLAGLVLVPVAVLFYLGRQRERRAAAAAFTTAPLAASVLPRRPGVRRHVPLVLLLAAITMLILATARPQVSAAVPDGSVSIMLATDVSGSMLATDIPPNRVTAAQHAANTFVLGVPTQVKIGVMQFNQTPTVLAFPSRDRAATFAALGRLTPGGGTAAGNAIEEAISVLGTQRTSAGKLAPGAIVLLSDGKTTSGADPLAAASDAARLRIPIYTVALGTPQGTIAVKRKDGTTRDQPVPPDPQALAQIAQISGGQTFQAADDTGLGSVYKNLGARLGRRNVEHQIGGYFIGSSLALLVLGSAASLLWFGRLV